MTRSAPGPEAVLAVDLGGTWLRVARVGPEGDILARDRVATPAAGRPEAVMDAVERLAAALGGRAGLAAAGVAVPGPLDPRSGLVFSPPNLEGWGSFPLAARLGERLGLPVWIHNDANLAALGEARIGAGAGRDPLLYLTISTGIGGGIVLADRLYTGRHGLAGELGHTVVAMGGPACRAGHPGCLEGLASGTAIARRAAEALAGGAESGALRRLMAGERPPTARDVATAAAGGDPLARRLFDEAGTALGLALGGYLNILDPARVVLGGGLTQAWELWAPALHRALPAVLMAPAARATDIVRAALGDDAGLVGAGLHAWERLAAG